MEKSESNKVNELGDQLRRMVYDPLVAGSLFLVAGWAGFMAGGSVFIFPSVGQTAYIIAESPTHPSSRIYNAIVGHAIGLLMGFFALWLTNAWSSPPTVSSLSLTQVRLVAAIIALVLTISFSALLRASHPPSGTTTLMVALGSIQNLTPAFWLLAGVAIVAILGAITRPMRIR